MTSLKKKFTAVALVTAAAALSGCADPKAAHRALDDAGYSDIQTGGWSMFGCGQDDDFTTTFTAKNPKGKMVDGVVCSSWFGKGATIRH